MPKVTAAYAYGSVAIYLARRWWYFTFGASGCTQDEWIAVARKRWGTRSEFVWRVRDSKREWEWKVGVLTADGGMPTP